MMSKIYDNIELVAPNGKLLSYISKRRADWYVKKGLTSFNSDNKIVLNFEPNGYGDADSYKNKRDNKCVICGTGVKLTRHHAVPYAFRKHFPDIYKDNNSADIIPMCRDHHDEYELLADKEKQKLFNRLAKVEMKFNRDVTRAKKALADLDFFEIMDHRKIEEKNKIITEFVIKYTEYERTDIPRIKLVPVEQVVIEKMGIENVVRFFKNHFEKSMECNFLPTNWDANEVKITDPR